MHCRKAKDDMVLFKSLLLSASQLSTLVAFIFNCYNSSRGFVKASALALQDRFLHRWPVKKTGWTNQSLWQQSPKSTSMKEGDVKSATQRNCMDHYQLWTNQTCFNSSHFRETGTKQKRYDRVGKDVTSDITRVVFRESSLLEIHQIRLWTKMAITGKKTALGFPWCLLNF